MAKSIYTQLVEDKKFEHVHAGYTYTFYCADYLETLTEEIANDENAMMEWARDEGVLHGLLWSGLADHLTKQHAIARYKDSNGNLIPIDRDKLDEFQTKIYASRPAVKTKPGTQTIKTNLDKMSTDDLLKLQAELEAKLAAMTK